MVDLIDRKVVKSLEPMVTKDDDGTTESAGFEAMSAYANLAFWSPSDSA